MKRFEINAALRDVSACSARNHCAMPPAPKWDITDFELGNFTAYPFTLINLTDEPEYLEKRMCARRGPSHTHALTFSRPPHRPLSARRRRRAGENPFVE